MVSCALLIVAQGWLAGRSDYFALALGYLDTAHPLASVTALAGLLAGGFSLARAVAARMEGSAHADGLMRTAVAVLLTMSQSNVLDGVTRLVMKDKVFDLIKGWVVAYLLAEKA